MNRFIILFGFIFSFFIFPVSAFAAVPNTPYLSAQGTSLYMNGQPYQFTGINAFNLGTYAGANAGCGNQENDLDGFFSRLRPNSMVRIWAFQGSITTNVGSKKTDWTGLDRVVAAAQKDGVKLIIVMGDQAGNCDDGHWRDTSWYAGGFKQAFNDYGNGLTPIPYLDYVKLVVARYKDSTAIAMWQPLDEPVVAECTGGKQGTACYATQRCTNEANSTKALRFFLDTVGGAIKSIDKNHLVNSGVGGDGQCGAIFEDYQSVNASPGIDVANYHDFGRETEPMPGDQWNGLQKRLNQTKLLNKPLMVGEIGMVAADNTTSCINFATRRDRFKAKMDAQFKAGIVGFMPWAMSDGVSTGCNYNIGDNDPTLALLHDYPVSMGTYKDTLAPTAPSALKAVATSPNKIALTWNASIDNVAVVRYDIFRNNVYYTSSTTTNLTDTNANPTTTYTYFVKAKDAVQNNSNSSNAVTLSVQPTAPTNLTATAVSPTQVSLSWTASTDAVGVVRYDIFRNNSYYTSSTSTSVTDANTKASTTYTYFVKGKNAAGNSSYGSNTVTITTKAK